MRQPPRAWHALCTFEPCELYTGIAVTVMPGVITGLFHVAIKTADLERTRWFYCGLLGLAEAARPDFGYPGAWIAVPPPVGEASIHIYAGGPAPGPEENGRASCRGRGGQAVW